MRSNIQTLIEPGNGSGNTFGWILLLLQFISVPLAIWGFITLLQGSKSDSAEFNALTVLLVSAATAYVALRGLRRVAWTSIPVLLTIEILFGFVFIPGLQFVTGADAVDGDYARAMFLVLIGFVAFAVGSLLLLNEAGFRFVPRTLITQERVALISVAMLGLGMIGKIAIWRLGLFAYTADPLTRTASGAILQWLNFLGSLLTAALVVSAIEVIGKRNRNPLMQIVFWLSLSLAIALGVVSGMKAEALYPVLDVMLVIGITQRRLPRTALLLPVLLVMFIYPFINAYRANINGGYLSQANTIGGLKATLVKSFDDAFLTYGSENRETGAENASLAVSRLSYLSCLRDVIEVPDPTTLNGDEKLWLAPAYAVIPRFLWKNKPVLNYGQRLSEALGRGNITSSAPTPIGDLYSMYGTYGVVIGMFVWGAFLQLYMNWIGKRDASEQDLFIYVLMVPLLLNLENDVVGELAGVIQTGIVVIVMSYLIYGPRASSTFRLGRLRLYGTQ